MRVVVEPRSAQLLEEVQDELAFAQAEEECRRSATEGTAEIEAERPEPEEM
jgi:hypothetical protein